MERKIYRRPLYRDLQAESPSVGSPSEEPCGRITVVFHRATSPWAHLSHYVCDVWEFQVSINFCDWCGDNRDYWCAYRAQAHAHPIQYVYGCRFADDADAFGRDRTY